MGPMLFILPHVGWIIHFSVCQFIPFISVCSHSVRICRSTLSSDPVCICCGSVKPDNKRPQCISAPAWSCYGYIAVFCVFCWCTVNQLEDSCPLVINSSTSAISPFYLLFTSIPSFCMAAGHKSCKNEKICIL